jgi:hypothetical protein
MALFMLDYDDLKCEDYKIVVLFVTCESRQEAARLFFDNMEDFEQKERGVSSADDLLNYVTPVERGVVVSARYYS